MKEKPILFSGPMVRAILDGKKTQTRRVVKPQPNAGFGWPYHNPADHTPGHFWFSDGDADNGFMAKSPFVAGLRLWVRESFWQEREGCTMPSGEYMDHWLNGGAIAYMAERPERDWGDKSLPWGDMAPRPSIHMPRWASRITLEVVGVRVERLQDISEDDALAEGAAKAYPYNGHGTYRGGFSIIWDFLNTKRGFGWGANPWVWVIEFKRVKEGTE